MASREAFRKGWQALALSKSEIAMAMVPLKGWKLDDDELVKVYKFKTYTEGVAFANAVAWLAEAANHHPEIDIEFRKVTIDLTTHSAGGVTEKDFALAAQIDALPRAAVPKKKPARKKATPKAAAKPKTAAAPAKKKAAPKAAK